MNKTLFFLLLLPVLIFGQIFGYLSFEEYCDMSSKIEKLIAKQAQYIDKFAQMSFVEKEQNISLLSDAIKCCEKALALSEKILKKIHEKSKADRRNILWVDAKKEQHNFRDVLRAQISFLQTYIEQAMTDVPLLVKFETFYGQSQQFSQLAFEKAKTCPMLTEENFVAFLQINQEITQLYENALSNAKSALALLQSMKGDLQIDKANVLQQIGDYEKLIANSRDLIAQCNAYIASRMQEAS